MTLSKKSLSILTALLLSGCGSDSDSSDNSSPTDPYPTLPEQPVTNYEPVKVIDGYLKDARVYDKTCTNELGVSDFKGDTMIDKNATGGEVCVKTDKSTFDMGRQAYVKGSFKMMAYDDSKVVTPFTSLVVEQVESDSGLSVEQAEQTIVDAISQGEQSVSHDLVFGDYVASHTTEADSVELIAETLVDMATSDATSDMSLDQKLSAIELVAKEIVIEVNQNNGVLPVDFAPVVNEDGTVSSNYKPTVVNYGNTPAPMSFLIDDGESVVLEPINVDGWFTDIDGDTLTYDVQTISLSGEVSVSNEPTDNAFSDSIWIDDNNNIVGYLKSHDSYTVHVYASDSNTTSIPLKFYIDVGSTDLAPEVDNVVKTQVSSEITGLGFQANEPISANTSVSIEGLFIDPEGEAMSYTVKHDTNATINVVGDTLVFKGLFEEGDAGARKLTIVANDGRTSVEASFVMLVAAADNVNYAPVIVDLVGYELSAQINEWHVVKGKPLNYTLDISKLFYDANGDQLALSGSSSLELNSSNNTSTGFTVNVSQNGVVTFSGNVPRSGNNEKLDFMAFDGIEKSSIQFTLPEIH